MQFSWDSFNADKIAGKHCIDTWEVEDVFYNGPTHLRSYTTEDGEARTVVVGHTDAGRHLVVAFTIDETAASEGTLRPVTAFPASEKLIRIHQGRS